ncbi:MAG: hypothetical protein GF329_01330 [Candidatus Lokiarchaeota archaeon]|nr:hypothetical protein [Candidatus Lokiarchaeota archaeon]
MNISEDHWFFLFVKALKIIFDDNFSGNINKNTYLLEFNTKNMTECIYALIKSFLLKKGYDVNFKSQFMNTNLRIIETR